MTEDGTMEPDDFRSRDELADEQVVGEDARGREVRRATEALLLVTESPLPVEVIARLLDIPTPRAEATCIELAADYDASDRGFQLVEVAGGWRFQTHPDLAGHVERFVLDGQSSRLSNAALETLAIVAYKQPISRAQVAAIRGVNVDGVMRTLVQRGYVDEIGRDSGPGQAVLYGTTSSFLEKLGLASLDQLPALGDFVPSAEVYEALEHGLRPEPLDPPLAATRGADDLFTDGGANGDAGSDEVGSDEVGSDETSE